jgi:hypothetical protein
MMTETIYECPWCYNNVPRGRIVESSDDTWGCPDCGGVTPRDDWDEDTEEDERGSPYGYVSPVSLTVAPSSEDRDDGLDAVRYATLSIDDVESVDVGFQNDEMSEYYGRTTHHTDESDDDESTSDSTSIDTDDHSLDDVADMKCACGARAVHRGDEIVCTDSDTVLWSKGDRDSTQIESMDSEKLEEAADKLRDVVGGVVGD